MNAGIAMPALPKSRKNSLRVMAGLDLELSPNDLAEPTGQEWKEKTHGKSDRHDFGPEKQNLPHNDALQSEKRPCGKIRNQRATPTPTLKSEAIIGK